MNMKKLFFILVSMLIPFVTMAQYYNPYAGHDFKNCSGKVTCGACYGTGNCYGYVCMSCGGSGLMNCAACAGARMGRQMAEQMERNRRNNPNALWAGIIENLGKGFVWEECYEKAYEDLEILTEEHDDGKGYLIMGWMNEMGIGISQNRSYAKKCYAWGADNGNKQCKNELQRINNGKYLNETNEKNFKKYYADLVTTAYSISQSINWDSGSSSSSSSSRSSSRRSSSGICTSCGGTGVNPTPNSGGSLSSWVAHYNSQGNKCPYCGSYTKHFHDKCSSCNVPRY